VCARDEADCDAFNLLLARRRDGLALTGANVISNLTIEPSLVGGKL
jgi:hypothetical protein